MMGKKAESGCSPGRAAVLAILGLSILLFTSMGAPEGENGSDTSSHPQTDTAAAENAAETAAKPEAQTVYIGYNRFLTQAFGPGEPPIEAIQQAVGERYPWITVELNIMPDDVKGMRNAIAIWMNGRDGTVDIYGMDTPWVTEFGKAGWALPLNGKIPGLEENFVAAGLSAFSHDGKIIGVPFWGSVSGLYYREDLLREAGYDGPPESYDEMIAMARAVRAKHPEITPFTWPGAKSEVLVMVYADFLFGFGGAYQESDGSYAFDSPESGRALEFMQSLIEDGYSPPEVPVWTQQESYRLFVEGKALFTWNNNDLVLWLDDPDRSKVVDSWGFAPSPAQPGGRSAAITGGFAFAVNPHSDVPDAALKVMEVIAGREVQKNFALAWGPIQYYQGLYDDPEVLEANRNADRINRVLPFAVNRPPAVKYSQLSNVLQEEVHSVLTNRKSVEEAQADITRRVQGLQ